MSELTAAVTQTEKGATESLPAEEAKVNFALESAAGRTGSMGQEQSQDPQESQPDQEQPSQLDTMNNTPQAGRRTSPTSSDKERKTWKGLWQDGGWIGSRMGSAPHEPETVVKTIWYQGESVDQDANEDWNRKEVNSQSVWYDSETTDQKKQEQPEQGMRKQKTCDLSLAQASGLSSPQLLEQDLTSYQLSAALSQPHAAGTQPALSHGPGPQRREVHGPQREEEVRPDWKEGGVDGDGGEVSNRERTYSIKSPETADIEDGRGEKQGNKERGAKGRKKRRKKRGKRGGAQAKLSSSSSIESQSQIEIKTQREQVTDLNTQSGTDSEAKDKTERADVRSPTQREEADEDAMHLPSQTEWQTRDAHGPDCEVTNLDPSYMTPDFSPTDDKRTNLTEVTALQTPETKELLEDDDLDFHGLDHSDLNSAVTASQLSQMDTRKADIEEIKTVQQVNMDTLDLTELELKGLASRVQFTVDNVGSKALSETEDLTVAGKAVTFVGHTGLVESNCAKELPVILPDCTEFTKDSFLEDFPEKHTQNVQSMESNKQVRPVNPMGRPVGVMEPLCATEAGDLLFKGKADVSPPQIREGCPETTGRENLEHCLGCEMLRDEQSKEEKRNELWVGEEEAGKGRSRSDDYDCGMVHAKELSPMDSEQEQNYSEDLVATAVAVVAVAVASAMASIELSQQLANNWSENEQSLNQLADDLLNNDQSTQPINKDRESCQLLAAETGHQPVEHSHIVPTNPFASKEQADVEISQESDSVVLPSTTETENLSTAQLSVDQQTNLDLSAHGDAPSLHQLDKEDVQSETAEVSKCLQFQEEDSKLQVNMKPLPEANEIITTEVDSQSHTQVEIPPCPVIDPGQHPEVSDIFCHGSEENHRGPQDQSVCQEESVIQHDEDNSHPLESITTDGVVGRQTHEQDSLHSSKCKEPESMSDSDRQTGEHERDPQLDGQVKTPCEGEIPTLAHTCDSTLPVTSWDLTPVAIPSPDEATAPANVETGEYQSSQSLPDMRLVSAIPLDDSSSMFQREGREAVAVDHALDAVDGWKEREKKKMQRKEEAIEEMVKVDITSRTAAEEECQQTRKDSDSTHTLQIQRERDVFYPVQPCPEPNTETTCTDVHPDREDCVSVCLLHRDKDSVKVSVKLDDSVFKKPKDPPFCVEHEDRGVCVSCSTTNKALTQEALNPTEGALSVGTPDEGTPQSPRLSWKSETEDRGRGETDEGGEEEEKKDHLSETPVSSAILQATIRSLSPPRRHSWELNRNNATADTDITQSSSLKSLSGEVKRAKPPLHRRSYSLEGLEVEKGSVQTQCPSISDHEERSTGTSLHLDSQERGSLVSLTEEEQERDRNSIDSQPSHQVLSVTNSCPAMFHHQSLIKSISMVAINQRDIDGVSSLSSNSGSLEYSISEEEPGPLRSDTEGKGGPKISRTFSYLRSKISKKGKEKDRKGERERESKDRDKKSANDHVLLPVSPSPSTASIKVLHNKETFLCNTASSASSVSSTSSSSSRERWSTVTTPDDQFIPRRHSSIFNPHSNLAKSISTSNIAGLDDVPLKGLKFLSQSTDSLNQGSKVSASTESLTDDGTEMIDSQLIGEFECDIIDLEADSWSGMMDKKFLKMLRKDEIKKQDVIYELFQTEVHHVRTLKIMSEVYYKGLQKELQFDTHTLDKIFPVLDRLFDTHSHFLTLLLERKRASTVKGQNNNSFYICSIGDILLNQFSGCSADRMKKVYGKFCSRHNEAVNLYKDLHAKDKRFQAFIKRTMSSSIVRRLSIPECILLVTQRITKYPVLIQRILQHTKDSDKDYGSVYEALRCVKELIMAVDSKVNEQEKKRRLREVYSRTDSKSIMRMKSGQMFAKEDLIRGRKLLHDGALQLKTSAGRLKDVQALLLSDVLVFLQEKDQKYVFASLDHRSTVISLQNLIVREVANEERGLFLITAGIERPEMVEVLASSKEERNTWRAVIQDTMHCMEKDEDEGVPSETEEDRKQQENKAKEIRELLRRKDEQIISLLEEKVHIFRDLSDWNPPPDDPNPPVREQMLFMATPDDITKGEPIIKDALREVETLHALVNCAVGGADCSVPAGLTGGSVGPVSLPRRAETFGGFDSHQMSSKNGEKEEGDDLLDLRRTESDSVLKKGVTASLQMLLKRNNEQVQHSVTHLHDLLISLQAVVVQQDSFIQEQRQTLNERLNANSSRHSSSSSLSSSSSSCPSSFMEQEKHRSLERQRQEAATLQKQQAAYQEEKRRREKAWDLKEKGLAEREERLRVEEEQTSKRRQELLEERETLQRKEEEYQREMERVREAQRRLERDMEALRKDTERLEATKRDKLERLQRYQRTPSTTSEDSIKFPSSGSLDLDSNQAVEQPKEVELSSSAPTKEPFLRIGSKRMSKSFNPFSSSKPQGAEKESKQLQLAKPKEKKDKKKKGKGEQTQTDHLCCREEDVCEASMFSQTWM
ncbi:uncharacterized protein akap13b isoform X2 [Epinephelus lanceolatus]